jgi:dTDP-4-amino-4,6-dideoxygalactose transaminase
MDELAAASGSGKVAIIEDACQAIGATYKNRPVGALGQMATFSFFPSKNLGGLGDGGLATTTDAALADRLKMLRAHGSRKKYHHEIVGGNFRLDALQCALLRAKLPMLHSWTRQRQAAAARYRELFGELRDGRLTLPPALSDRTHVFHQFVIRTPQRDELRSWLTGRGVGTEVYYPRPLHLQPCFASLGYREGAFPIAEKACQEALALPIFPGITEEQQAAVVAEVAAFFRK